jgi:hypothetical protein
LPLGFRNDCVVCGGGIDRGDYQELPARQRLSPAFERPNRAPEGVSTYAERSNPGKVMSLKRNGDFLMHGVVLQIRVFRPAAR